MASHAHDVLFYVLCPPSGSTSPRQQEPELLRGSGLGKPSPLGKAGRGPPSFLPAVRRWSEVPYPEPSTLPLCSVQQQPDGIPTTCSGIRAKWLNSQHRKTGGCRGVTRMGELSHLPAVLGEQWPARPGGPTRIGVSSGSWLTKVSGKKVSVASLVLQQRG